jgi:thioesterase domain-containing protein
LGPTPDPKMVERVAVVLKANVAAMLRYSPRHAAIGAERVVVLHALGTKKTKNINLHAAGWQALCRARIERHAISGDHYSIMEAPRVTLLAETLARALGDL